MILLEELKRDKIETYGTVLFTEFYQLSYLDALYVGRYSNNYSSLSKCLYLG